VQKSESKNSLLSHKKTGNAIKNRSSKKSYLEQIKKMYNKPMSDEK